MEKQIMNLYMKRLHTRLASTNIAGVGKSYDPALSEVFGLAGEAAKQVIEDYLDENVNRNTALGNVFEFDVFTE